MANNNSMLVKNIQKPDDYDRYLQTKDFWFIKYNTSVNIDNLLFPQNLGEKLMWYNLYCTHKSKLFFKSTAKDEIKKILGTDKYLVPTYQICNNINEINWNNLINKKIVIKPDNKASSNGVVIYKRQIKQKDIPVIAEEIRNNEFLVNNKFIIEKFIGKSNAKSVFQTDYKFWCFFGKVVFIEVINGRQENNAHICYSTFFDINFKRIDVKRADYQQCKKAIRKPKNLQEMIYVAEKISKNIPAIRVDLYNINGKIYFGECTRLYCGHCNFDSNNGKKLSYLFDLSRIPQQIIQQDNMNYDIKISRLTEEAKEILNCNDDDFEFIWSINHSNVPIYRNNKYKNISIYYKMNLWHK